MRKLLALITIFLFFSVSGCGENNTSNPVSASQKPDWTPREMLQACGSIFFYLSEIEKNTYTRGALNNAAYNFVNTARYGYDKPYFNKDAESDSKMGANRLIAQNYNVNDAKSMARECKEAGKEYAIILTGTGL